jgi:hypothetical protein
MPVPKNLRGPNKYGGYRGDGGGAPGSAAIFPPGWGRGRDRRGRVPGRSHTSAGPAAAPRAPDRSPTTEPTISYASAGRLRAILVISMAYVCCGRVGRPTGNAMGRPGACFTAGSTHRFLEAWRTTWWVRKHAASAELAGAASAGGWRLAAGGNFGTGARLCSTCRAYIGRQIDFQKSRCGWPRGPVRRRPKSYRVPPLRKESLVRPSGPSPRGRGSEARPYRRYDEEMPADCAFLGDRTAIVPAFRTGGTTLRFEARLY